MHGETVKLIDAQHVKLIDNYMFRSLLAIFHVVV